MSKHLLLVDDSAIVRQPLEIALQSRGYQVASAADGEQAMRLMRQQRPDVVILDLALPKMNGLAVMAAMRRDPSLRSIGVLVLTAVSDKQTVLEAGKLGARAYLLKSRFSLDELFERIESAARPPDAAPPSPAGQTDRPGPAESTPAQSTSPPAAPPSQAPDAPAENPSPLVTSSQSNETELLKSLRPIVTRSQMDQAIEKAGELKALSPTVGQLMKMTASSRYSIEQIARVVKQDQAIALKVLKMANSAGYTRGEPAESVQSAVMRIGLTQIRQVVMNISVIDQFSHSLDASPLNIFGFWEHAIATGLIAAHLTRLREGRESEVEAAFTMGLLHDVGRMVLIDQMGPVYGRVLEAAQRLQLPLERVESRLLLVNHADLMDRVLHRWKFAKPLVNSIALHHLSLSNLRSIAPRTILPDATLALANRLAHALLLGSSGNHTIYPTEDFAETLKIGPDQVARIEQTIPDQTHDLKCVMLQTTAASAWPSQTRLWRQQLAGPFRPLFLSRDPAIDAYRMVCQRLQDQHPGQQEHDRPNLAVVHFRSVTDRAELADRLKQAEQHHDTEPLPLLMISPKGNILFDERTLAGRSYLTLACPTHLGRLLHAVNLLLDSTNPHAQDAPDHLSTPTLARSA